MPICVNSILLGEGVQCFTHIHLFVLEHILSVCSEEHDEYVLALYFVNSFEIIDFFVKMFLKFQYTEFIKMIFLQYQTVFNVNI
jgi:hypothetical protein